MVMIGCGSRYRVLKDMICPQIPPGPILLQAVTAVTAVPSLCLEIQHRWCHKSAGLLPKFDRSSPCTCVPATFGMLHLNQFGDHMIPFWLVAVVPG